ncbi:unnamed protein product [Cuscuta europaea]|uniref:Zinc finger PHD-type domain-containing protein n=1 Tax=Cuscuta europaea TaxID=41803 RepID=A0A9P0ZVV9_CUSEU|nr:unnamed protein product [Cuscuta europaea]
MASGVIEACRTRRRNRRPFPFETFATAGTVGGLSGGVFRDDVRLFLQEFAGIEDYAVAGMPLWSVWFIASCNGAVFPLYIIEEPVQYSPQPFCDHCKFAGWGHHYVSKRRYHFIIPANVNWEKRLASNCMEIGTSRHTLHGMIHCNGYGHLLFINGLTGDESPDSLRGTDFMNFWDRLCTALKTRKVSVFDVSMKGGMELRLLYGATHGMPWFGKWGYKFNRGSFGVTEKKYNSAIEYLQSLSLDQILNDFKTITPGRRRNIKEVIDKYREMSQKPLITISELLQFIMLMRRRSHTTVPTTQPIQNTNSNKLSNLAAKHHNEGIDPVSAEAFVKMLVKSDCRWPVRRLDFVLHTIVDLLKETDGGMLTRQELRDGARKCVGDTGLIDFVLKSIRCFSSGNHIVRRATNPTTKLLEFRIFTNEESSNDEKNAVVSRCSTRNPSTTKRIEFLVPGCNHIDEDLKLLYFNVLLAYPAGQLILDSKRLVKEWGMQDVEAAVVGELRMRLTCQVLPSFEELETELTRPLTPGEVVVVPGSITIGELKRVAQAALRDTHCIMEKFEVRQVGGLRGIEDERVVKGCVGVDGSGGAHVWVRGCGLDLECPMRYQDGVGSSLTMSSSKVECVCGTKEDDGERMVECEGCQVWQHTRCCCGIEDDDEDTPPSFLCEVCRGSGHW